MITVNALKHLESISQDEIARYTNYLKKIQPTTHEDKFRRWLFTYASVHTSWKMNCKIYQALEDLEWLGDKEELKRRLITIGAGMHNKRSEFMSEFAEFFWDHPDWLNKATHEDWRDYRDRIQNVVKGIGQAKAAFLTELTYPLQSQVICVDTHILQLYGHTSKDINLRGIRAKDIDKIEEHWRESCMLWHLPCVASRWLYWDRKQGYSDSRYWSVVLEGVSNGRLEESADITHGSSVV